MATYIRELLELPAQVNKGDFVLNLAAGVSEINAAETLRKPLSSDAVRATHPNERQCFDRLDVSPLQG